MGKRKQIVGMGGGGFSMEPENPKLDQYVLSLTGKERPRVCFLPTASGDAEGYILRFYQAMTKLNAEPSYLSLIRPNVDDMRSFVLAQDVLYVGGGNTVNLLALWRAWGLDAILREAWEQGVILAGLSAGSICWFEQGVTDSFPGGLSPLPCLGFLPGSNCPHYDGEPERRPAYQRLVAEGRISAGIACDDGVALHYVDQTLSRVVSSRPNARAYRVSGSGEEVITPELL